MPVVLNVIETTVELGQTNVEVILESASEPGPAGPGVPTGGTINQVLTKDSATDFDTSWQDAQGGAGGAPTDADYLVGTAHGDLSAEIVVGTTPGGELGGTWASPTVDATHSGSSHAGVQAAAEATAAAALTAHEADTTAVHGIANTANLYSVGGTDVAIADGGTGASTAAGARANLDLEAGTDFPSLATFNDHSARHEDGGADEITIQGLAGTPVELTNHLNDAADAHDASAISFTPAGTIAATDVQAAIEEVAAEAGGGTGEALQRSISQTGHGLAVGDVVIHDGTDFIKAQGNSAANSEVVGIVSAVADVNTFTLHYGGRVTGLSGLTAGETYFLDDDTAGLLTTTEPSDAGDVSKPLLIADSTTTGYFFNWRGVVVADMATQAELDAHINDSSDAHDASAISVLDTGGDYTATDVEGVLAEIAPQLGGGGPVELAYVQFTSNVTISATVEDSANSIVSAGAVSFDGSTIVLIEFFCQRVDTSGYSNSNQVVLNLFDGASDIGRIAQCGPGVTTGGGFPIHGVHRLTPSNGSHTYSIRGWLTTAGSVVAQAGTGGDSTSMPGFIRIITVAT